MTRLSPVVMIALGLCFSGTCFAEESAPPTAAPASSPSATTEPFHQSVARAITYLQALAEADRASYLAVAVRAPAGQPVPIPDVTTANNDPQFSLAWGKLGAAEGEFNFPIGITIDSTGEVLVTDFYNGRVQRFSPEGTFLASFAVAPFPGGITIDDQGSIYVTHAGIPPSKYDKPRERDKIAVYSPTGQLLREWGKFGTGDGQFDMPGGIAIRGDRVVVADQCNRRVQVFESS